MQGITFRPFVFIKQSPYRDRTDIIKLFVDKLNAGRVGTKFPPLKFIAIQNKCSAMSDAQLFAFLNDCEKAKNFSSYFFYQLNPKKHVKNENRTNS